MAFMDFQARVQPFLCDHFHSNEIRIEMNKFKAMQLISTDKRLKLEILQRTFLSLGMRAKLNIMREKGFLVKEEPSSQVPPHL